MIAMSIQWLETTGQVSHRRLFALLLSAQRQTLMESKQLAKSSKDILRDSGIPCPKTNMSSRLKISRWLKLSQTVRDTWWVTPSFIVIIYHTQNLPKTVRKHLWNTTRPTTKIPSSSHPGKVPKGAISTAIVHPCSVACLQIPCHMWNGRPLRRIAGPSSRPFFLGGPGNFPWKRRAKLHLKNQPYQWIPENHRSTIKFQNMFVLFWGRSSKMAITITIHDHFFWIKLWSFKLSKILEGQINIATIYYLYIGLSPFPN